MEALISEGDVDAIYIADFENAAGDLLQSDEELAACYNTYVEARQRLAAKAKHGVFGHRRFAVEKEEARVRARASSSRVERGRIRSIQSAACNTGF